MTETIIEVDERVCDGCNCLLVNEQHKVVEDFYWTTWGLVCEDCWAKNWAGKPEMEELLLKKYHTGETVFEDWAYQLIEVI